MASEGLQSMVQNVPAGDGTTFDILRNAPPQAADIRGRALVSMRQIAQDAEPDLLGYLQTGSGTSAEYATSSAILHSKKPDVKAQLVGVAINRDLEEGYRDSAVSMLAYANAAELPLEQYREPWVEEQFNLALQENNPGAANAIASEMLRKGTKIVPSIMEADESGQRVNVTEQRLTERWQPREAQSFKTHAEQVNAETNPDEWELRGILGSIRFRTDFSPQTDPVAKQIVDKVVQLDMSTPGRQWTALIDAQLSGMPEDYVEDIRRQVKPTVIERATDYAKGIQAKIGQLISKK